MVADVLSLLRQVVEEDAPDEIPEASTELRLGVAPAGGEIEGEYGIAGSCVMVADRYNWD